MKILCKSSVEYVDEVCGKKIYWDRSTGKTYVYTKPNGKGKMEFPNVAEARRWLEDQNIKR